MSALSNRYRYGTGALPPEPKPPSIMRRLVSPTTDLPTEAKLWTTGPILNQYGLGACSAFATVAELIAEPQSDLTIDPKIANQYGRNHFQRARVLGGWTPLPTKGSPNDGSYVYRNMEASIGRGMLENYNYYVHPAHTIEEVLKDLVENGPSVLTLKWYRSFEATNKVGLMTYKPSGTDRGYHAMCLSGYDPLKSMPQPDVWKKGKKIKQPNLPPEPMVRIRNSWGTSWGAVEKGESKARIMSGWAKRDGNGWLRVRDLRTMFEAGEAYAHAPISRLAVDIAAVLKANPDPTVS